MCLLPFSNQILTRYSVICLFFPRDFASLKFLSISLSCFRIMMRNPIWLTISVSYQVHLSLFPLAIALVAGCSKEEMNKMVEQVQSKTTAAVKETVAKIAPTGSVQFGSMATHLCESARWTISSTLGSQTIFTMQILRVV